MNIKNLLISKKLLVLLLAAVLLFPFFIFQVPKTAYYLARTLISTNTPVIDVSCANVRLAVIEEDKVFLPAINSPQEKGGFTVHPPILAKEHSLSINLRGEELFLIERGGKQNSGYFLANAIPPEEIVREIIVDASSYQKVNSLDSFQEETESKMVSKLVLYDDRLSQSDLGLLAQCYSVHSSKLNTSPLFVAIASMVIQDKAKADARISLGNYQEKFSCEDGSYILQQQGTVLLENVVTPYYPDQGVSFAGYDFASLKKNFPFITKERFQNCKNEKGISFSDFLKSLNSKAETLPSLEIPPTL